MGRPASHLTKHKNMGKIGRLSGKSGDENITIYPLTIPQAVIDPDTKKKLRDELDEIKQSAVGGIEEAPMDGKYYARKDGAWADINQSALLLTIKTNQSAHTDVSAVKALVSYEGGSTELGNGDLMDLSIGTEYTITFPEVEGYKKPDTIVFTAQKNEKITKEGIYQTEVVTVNVTAEDGSSVAGQQVTINGGVFSIDESGQVITKVPFDTSYSVSVDAKSGYTSPSSQSFTASQASRVVSMIYETIKLGVFIQDKSGKLWTTDNWDASNNANANAIAVLTNNVKVLVALTDSGGTKQISSDYESPIENYCTAISDMTAAKADYDGKTNTANILKTVSSTSYAAGWANAFTFPDGTKGHLPALGEFWEVYQNKAAVDAALAKCGGTAMNTSYYHWCSTFWGVDSFDYRYCWFLDWSNGYTGRDRLDSYNYVRAFAAYSD